MEDYIDQSSFIVEVINTLDFKDAEYTITSINEVYPKNTMCLNYVKGNIMIQMVYAHHMANLYDVSVSRDYCKTWYYWTSGDYKYNEISVSHRVEVLDDILEKIQSLILEDREFDERIIIPLDIPQDVYHTLLEDAHMSDMTFNDYMENLIENAMNDSIKNFGDGM